MSDYIASLEKQNEELKEKLAKSEIDNIRLNRQIEKNAPFCNPWELSCWVSPSGRRTVPPNLERMCLYKDYKANAFSVFLIFDRIGAAKRKKNSQFIIEHRKYDVYCWQIILTRIHDLWNMDVRTKYGYNKLYAGLTWRQMKAIFKKRCRLLQGF